MSQLLTSSGSPLLQPRIPETLPISSGTSAINQKIAKTNLQIQTLISQSQANTLYDPSPPPYETHSKQQATKEGFVGNLEINPLFVVTAISLIVLGILMMSKKNK